VRTKRRKPPSSPTWKHEDQRKLRFMRESGRGQPKRILKDSASERDQPLRTEAFEFGASLIQNFRIAAKLPVLSA